MNVPLVPNIREQSHHHQLFKLNMARLCKALLLLLTNSLVVEVEAEEECCSRKPVGSISYTLTTDNILNTYDTLTADNTLTTDSDNIFHGGQLPQQCLNDCHYTVDGTSSSKS